MKFSLLCLALFGAVYVFGAEKVRFISRHKSIKDLHNLKASYDYEDPYPDGDCNTGETAIEVEGISGAFCSPPCNSDGSCPENIPPNVTATPMCILENESTGAKYCALTCETRDTPECGAAQCQKIESSTLKFNLWDQEVGAYDV